MVFKYPNLREPHPPHEILFGGNSIIPLQIGTPAISLGVLMNKNCTFTSQVKKVSDQIKAVIGLIKQNFSNLTLKLLEFLYRVYVMPILVYCSQVWHTGDEVHLRSIERAVELFWRLSPTGGPPANFIRPRLQLIIFDLNYVKKLYDGKTVLNFNEIFKTQVSNNSRPNEEETIGIQRHRLKLARYRFSHRTKNYWNLLPIETRHMSYASFKNEVVKFVTENAQAFLNFGDKNPVVGKELVLLIKLTKKAREEKEKVISKNKNSKRLQKKEEPKSKIASNNRFDRFGPKSKIALNDCIGKNIQKQAIK
jgi:hypothetical protein